MALKVWVLWFKPALRAGNSCFSVASVWPALAMEPFLRRALISALARGSSGARVIWVMSVPYFKMGPHSLADGLRQ